MSNDGNVFDRQLSILDMSLRKLGTSGIERSASNGLTVLALSVISPTLMPTVTADLILGQQLLPQNDP
jgi:hypothetical protein